MSETEQEETQRPLTIAMVVDTSGNRGNGTSNSALQWAEELKRQGHTVRLVGIGAPEYPARVNHVPLVSWVAKKQQMQFAEPSDTLFRTAFRGVDVVHIYTPFRFGQHACKVAKQMGIAVTAGYHVQPENITYSAGPLKYIPGIDKFIYWLFNLWLYRKIDHVHVPTELGASLLRSHGYKSKLRRFPTDMNHDSLRKRSAMRGSLLRSVPHCRFRTIDERKESCHINSCDRPLQACARY